MFIETKKYIYYTRNIKILNLIFKRIKTFNKIYFNIFQVVYLFKTFVPVKKKRHLLIFFLIILLISIVIN